MRFKDDMKMKGTLHYEVFRKGRKIETFERRNLIVDSGRYKLARIMAGEDTGYIAKIGVGSGSATPAATDTTLTDLILVPVASEEITRLTERFNFLIDTGTANGLNIKEFGLFFDDGTMFSRRVRENGSDLVKADDIEISGWWEIDF